MRLPTSTKHSRALWESVHNTYPERCDGQRCGGPPLQGFDGGMAARFGASWEEKGPRGASHGESLGTSRDIGVVGRPDRTHAPPPPCLGLQGPLGLAVLCLFNPYFRMFVSVPMPVGAVEEPLDPRRLPLLYFVWFRAVTPQASAGRIGERRREARLPAGTRVRWRNATLERYEYGLDVGDIPPHMEKCGLKRPGPLDIDYTARTRRQGGERSTNEWMGVTPLNGSCRADLNPSQGGPHMPKGLQP